MCFRSPVCACRLRTAGGGAAGVAFQAGAAAHQGKVGAARAGITLIALEPRQSRRASRSSRTAVAVDSVVISAALAAELPPRHAVTLPPAPGFPVPPTFDAGEPPAGGLAPRPSPPPRAPEVAAHVAALSSQLGEPVAALEVALPGAVPDAVVVQLVRLDVGQLVAAEVADRELAEDVVDRRCHLDVRMPWTIPWARTA